MRNKNYVDFNEKISAIDFARKMFESTADNGTLYLKGWYDVDCEDFQTYDNFVATIIWSVDDLQNAINEFNNIYNDLDVFVFNLEDSDNLFEHKLICHAQRLNNLLSNGAPEIVQNQEERMLMASIIINAFGKIIVKVG